MTKEPQYVKDSSKDAQRLPLFKFDQEVTSLAAGNADTEDKESPYSRHITYVDESGDHSLQSIDENYPIFVLAFCVFHKRHYSEVIVPALEKFKFNHFGHDQVVLHENEIRRRKDYLIFLGTENTNRHLWMS